MDTKTYLLVETANALAEQIGAEINIEIENFRVIVHGTSDYLVDSLPAVVGYLEGIKREKI